MKTGDIYVITSGTYSDYSIVDVIEAVRDFDFDEVAGKAYLKLKKLGDNYVSPSDLCAELIKDGYVKSCERAAELYFGNYGELRRDAEKQLLARQEEKT